MFLQMPTCALHLKLQPRDRVLQVSDSSFLVQFQPLQLLLLAEHETGLHDQLALFLGQLLQAEFVLLDRLAVLAD